VAHVSRLSFQCTDISVRCTLRAAGRLRGVADGTDRDAPGKRSHERTAREELLAVDAVVVAAEEEFASAGEDREERGARCAAITSPWRGRQRCPVNVGHDPRPFACLVLGV
jgi:hypothetical protein